MKPIKTLRKIINRVQVNAITLSAVAMLGLVSSGAVVAKPDFQFSASCGQVWDVSTYDNHWPDPDSLDATIRGSGQLNKGKGEPVRAMAPGVVTRSYIRASDGEARVFIEHDDGWVTHYIHNQVTDYGLIKEGRRVAQGEVIAFTGKSGASSVHQHITQINPSGKAVRQYFDGNAVKTYQADPGSWGHWGQTTAEKIRSANCAGNQFMTWSQGGENYLLTYRPSTSEGRILRLKENGQTEQTWIGHLGSGWTHFAAYRVGANVYATFYQGADGDVNFVRMHSQGAGFTKLGQTRWYDGWTHLVPFVRGGDAYVLAYSSLYGFVNVEKIHPDGSGTTNIKKTTWPKGYTSLLTYTSGPRHYLLSYKGSDGKFATRRISGSESALNFSIAWEQKRLAGWTTLLPMVHQGQNYMFGYEAPTGEAKIWRLDSHGQGFSKTGDKSMQKDWTAFAAWYTPSGAKMLGYKIRNGKRKAFSVDANGSGLSQIHSGSWNIGWR